VALTARPVRKRRGASSAAVADDGRMTLIEHLRELRSRLFKSVLAITVGFVVGWLVYRPLFNLLLDPFLAAVEQIRESRDIDAKPVLTGVADAFLLQTKVALVAGIVLASPVWLYQLWAFILPGLHRHERKWTMIFVSIAGPLFFAGVLLGYYALPKGLEILLAFTPDEVANLVQVNGYLSFALRILLVFGVAFEIPLFVVLLNLAGVVSGRQLGQWRSWIIFATFVFAAVATPSTDPITMLLLALPMTVLFGISEVIARLVDRRRAAESAEPDYEALPDDETSPLRLRYDPADDEPSPRDLG
jgi:sec-independent protein translocase protein TatC